MMNQKISQQNWSSVKGEIQKSFANLSAEELEETHGDANLLTDLVAEKLGLRRAEAEKRLDEIVARRGSETTSSYDEEDDFQDYVDVNIDDERFGADEGLTTPASHSQNASTYSDERSAERIPRQDSNDRNRSSAEYSSERRSPDTNPGSSTKKTDRTI
jgi:hypothetical protein